MNKINTAPQHYTFVGKDGQNFDLNWITKQAFESGGKLDLSPFEFAKLIEAFQYIARANRKNGMDDISKARDCLDVIIGDADKEKQCREMFDEVLQNVLENVLEIPSEGEEELLRLANKYINKYTNK